MTIAAHHWLQDRNPVVTGRATRSSKMSTKSTIGATRNKGVVTGSSQAQVKKKNKNYLVRRRQYSYPGRRNEVREKREGRVGFSVGDGKLAMPPAIPLLLSGAFGSNCGRGIFRSELNPTQVYIE